MFCKGFGSTLKRTVLKLSEATIAKADLALRVTTALQTFLSSPLVGVVVKVTKTTADDVLLPKVLSALRVSIDALEITVACKDEENLEAKSKCFVTELRKESPYLQEAILIKLASLVTKYLDADDKQKQAVYDTLVQGKFLANK